MKEHYLSDKDQEGFGKYHTQLKKVVMLMAIMQLVTFIVITAVMILNKIEFWYLILALILVTDIISLTILSKNYRLARLDAAEGMKIMGNFKVLQKTYAQNRCTITLEGDNLPKLIVSSEQFDEIHSGEDIYAEFAKNSGYVFALKVASEMAK
jgi:hypothetical protein